MSDLSIFVDESGDSGNSKYYLITLVFHDQDMTIRYQIERYHASLLLKSLPLNAFHFSPLINGHDNYTNMNISQRKMQLATFRMLASHLHYTYKTFSYRKTEVKHELENRMKRDLIVFMFDNLGFFQSFDSIKVYYDNGQHVVTAALRGAIEYSISKEATIYRDASPQKYVLSQLADYVCGIEFTALKYATGEQTNTDRLFFGDKTSFKKNWLKKIRKNELGGKVFFKK